MANLYVNIDGRQFRVTNGKKSAVFTETDGTHEYVVSQGNYGCSRCTCGQGQFCEHRNLAERLGLVTQKQIAARQAISA